MKLAPPPDKFPVTDPPKPSKNQEKAEAVQAVMKSHFSHVYSIDLFAFRFKETECKQICPEGAAVKRSHAR